MARYNQYKDKETILLEKLRLNRFSKNHTAKYDAFDEEGNLFELKSPSSSNVVSTSRDAGKNHINKWRKLHWIIGKWDNEIDDYTDIYYLSPNDMKEWIDEVEAKMDEMHGLGDEVRQLSIHFSEHKKRLLNKILVRGCTLNDPRIPGKYVIKKGTKIQEQVDIYVAMRKKEEENGRPFQRHYTEYLNDQEGSRQSRKRKGIRAIRGQQNAFLSL